jgi:hypothetical protein
MTKGCSPETHFRPRSWLRFSSLAAAIALAIGAAYLKLRGGTTAITALCAILSVAAAAGFVQTLTTCIEFGEDSLVISSWFSTKQYARTTLESVTWEAGSGVALRLTDGAWLKLPELGHDSQALSNSIRAWLRRTEAKKPE